MTYEDYKTTIYPRDNGFAWNSTDGQSVSVTYSFLSALPLDPYGMAGWLLQRGDMVRNNFRSGTRDVPFINTSSPRFYWTIAVLFLLYGFQSIQCVAQEPMIVLQRNGCWEGCPEYEISIFTNGTVLYSGRSRVAVIGESTSNIDPKTVQQLRAEFEKVKFFLIDTSDAAVNRDEGPCRRKVVHDCQAVMLQTTRRSSIIELCEKLKTPTVTTSVGIRPCYYGDKLYYRDNRQNKWIVPEILRSDEPRQQLTLLQKMIETVVGANKWLDFVREIP